MWNRLNTHLITTYVPAISLAGFFYYKRKEFDDVLWILKEVVAEKMEFKSGMVENIKT